MKLKYLKFFITLLLFTTVTSVVSFDVKANSGPPVNAQITIINAESDYNLDILIYREEQLTQIEIDDYLSILDSISENLDANELQFQTALAAYQDEDGFLSLTIYGRRSAYLYDQDATTNSTIYKMYLDVPREFKVFIYTDQGVIITSELITMDQFDYRLTYDLKDVDMSFDQDGVGLISGFIGNPWHNITTWGNFLIRVIFTCLVELGVLFLFGFRKKSTFLFITILNIISQSILTYLTIMEFYTSFNSGYSFFFTFVFGEFLIFVSEMILVVIFVKEKSKIKRVLYSFSANFISMISFLLLTGYLMFLL